MLLPLQWDIDEDVSSETDIICSKYCLPLLKGFWVGGVDFCCSKSRQQLVSTRSSGIDMGDDLSGALTQYSMYPLIFLAVLLHDHQSYYCGSPAAICSQHLTCWSEWTCCFQTPVWNRKPLDTLLSCSPYWHNKNLNVFITWAWTMTYVSHAECHTQSSHASVSWLLSSS